MKKWLGLILIGSSMAFVGCGSAPTGSDPGEPSQNQNAPSENAPSESVQGLNAQEQNVSRAPAASCENCAGFYYCPSTGQEWEYWAPGCGGMTVVQARQGCQAHCSGCTWGGGC